VLHRLVAEQHLLANLKKPALVKKNISSPARASFQVET
jgi:hypothetical protein